MATVSQIAQQLNCSLADLIKELSNLNPSVKWKVDTNVPDEVAAKFTQEVYDYASTEATTQPLGAIAASNGGALGAPGFTINADAIQWGYLSAMSELDMVVITNQAIDDGLAEIKTYYGVKGQLWQQILDQKANAAIQRQQTTAQNRVQAGEDRQAYVTKSFEYTTNLKAKIDELKKDSEGFLGKMTR